VAGGIAIPADAALAMQLGAEGVSWIGHLQEREPAKTAEAIVQATLHFDNPKIIAEVSKGLGSPMRGIAAAHDPGGGASGGPGLVARRSGTHGPAGPMRTRSA